MKLYEINTMLEEAVGIAYESMNKETGEINEDWANFLDEIELERHEKVVNVALYCKNLKAEAEAIRAEEKTLAHRRHALEAMEARLRKYLCGYLTQGEKVKAAQVAIGWRKSTAVVIDNEAALPDMYMRIEKRPIKKAIMEDMDLGKFDFAGIAHVEERQNLQII